MFHDSIAASLVTCDALRKLKKNRMHIFVGAYVIPIVFAAASAGEGFAFYEECFCGNESEGLYGILNDLGDRGFATRKIVSESGNVLLIIYGWENTVEDFDNLNHEDVDKALKDRGDYEAYIGRMIIR